MYIHGGHIKCQLEHHNIDCTTALLRGRNNAIAKVNVNYCRDCDLFFISKEEFAQYRELYGILIGNFAMEDLFNYSGSGYYKRDAESTLHMNGYSVSQKDGLTDKERQYILSSIINDDIMEKWQVIDYLNMLISTNGKKHGNELAVSKWMADIEFVRNYDIDKQMKSQITSIDRYRRRRR